MRKPVLGLVAAALALALVHAPAAEAAGGRFEAGRAGGPVAKPIASGTGVKPGWSGGGGWDRGRHWDGGRWDRGRHWDGGGWDRGRHWDGGRWDRGRHWDGGRWDRGRHWDGGGWRGWHGHRHWRGHYYYPWAIGLGFTFAWPWWGYAAYYPYYIEYPVGEVREYLDPEPMPYRPPPWAQSYRFYCPPAAAYYPDVKTCAQPWLKVLPHDAGPAAPPSDSGAVPQTEQKLQQ